MSDYIPNKWLMVELPHGHHKIFGSWAGGYSYGDSWKLNSGVEKVKYLPETFEYLVFGFSGSIYRITPENHGATAYTIGVIEDFIKASDGKMKLLTFEESIVILNKYTE